MNTEAPTPRLQALPAVCDRTSMARNTVLRAVERGDFPPPVRISRNRIAWREDEVTAWINSRPVAA